MSTNENVETCKKAYAAFAEGDVETVMTYYDDDVEFVVPGNSTVSGTYRAAAGVTELWAKLAEQSGTMTPSRFLADGDNVVVIGQFTAGGESAPKPYWSPSATAKSSNSRATRTQPCWNVSSALSRGARPRRILRT